MDLTNLLLMCQDPTKRSEAEAQLATAEQSNPAQLFPLLAAELANEEKPLGVRQLAGLVLKNALSKKDKARKKECQERWLALDENVKAGIRELSVKTLTSSKEVVARKTSAQVISAIGGIELPRGQWKDLVPGLAEQAQKGDPLTKQVVLTCFGYLSEELATLVAEAGVELPADTSSQIVTAVVQGMRDEYVPAKLEATKAFYYVLILAESNFNDENQRNFMMEVVCENAKHADDSIKVAAYEDLVQAVSEYYDFMAPYMPIIGNLSFECISKERDNLAIPAMELWSSICDEEIFLKDIEEEAKKEGRAPPRQSQNFIRQALGFLIPLLTEKIAAANQQLDEEDDDDTWSAGMAAGTCLSLVAQVVGDDCVEPVLVFVNNNFGAPDWHHREAAILAYGSIMDGPSTAKLGPPVQASLPHIVAALNDQSVAVRDTAAWTIGRIAQFHTPIFAQNPQMLAELIPVLFNKLQDEPRVAVNICWIFDVLGSDQDRDASTTILSPYFIQIVQKLLETAQRPDGAKRGLRNAAYAAVSSIVSGSGRDVQKHMPELAGEMASRLEQILNPAVVQQLNDKECELHGHICGNLQVVTQRMRGNADMEPMADKLMQLYMGVFELYQHLQQASHPNVVVVHEEALLAVTSLASALGEKFNKYMPQFGPVVIAAISNHEEFSVCQMAIGAVGDLARALDSTLAGGPNEPLLDKMMEAMVMLMQNQDVDKRLKPDVFRAISDVALAVKGAFAKYLPTVMAVAQQATAITASPDADEEWIDYVNDLRSSVLEAYTGIIHGMRDGNKLDLLKDYVQSILEFVVKVADDGCSSPNTLKSALGVVGDLVMAFQQQLTSYLRDAPFLSKLVTLGSSLGGRDPQVAQTTQWLQRLFARYGAQ
ncbi:importin/karyopherin, putative [Perkinsus marinus ATCC 50983]|uniref:Importin/karyopherin, putative n=1 Tax=Perkinsus marinus (strain ATCC 50983 / TXsc) TaxID=423536 RepID=C5KXN7_PERM5|nr:importin/karyopherin, putative [Perkinsus marinus ATCC 50983]EER10761.1 importin/karyopherin, putative [Perkinsus marinus ATCC 50983]|eukprot:XP_002778966.1 importin/karyopherin, putative [Perkinsus marinus ATCC 50983]